MPKLPRGNSLGWNGGGGYGESYLFCTYQPHPPNPLVRVAWLEECQHWVVLRPGGNRVRKEARLNLLLISEKKRGKILSLNSTRLFCISNKYYSTQNQNFGWASVQSNQLDAIFLKCYWTSKHPNFLTYNELDHSLSACVPVSTNF
jgi:hypothetical protein